MLTLIFIYKTDTQFSPNKEPFPFLLCFQENKSSELDMVTAKSLDTHIHIDPKIRGGKPCITGRRIAVHDLAIWHEHLGMSIDAIAVDYDLEIAYIYIGLGYYFANKEQIDEEIRLAKEEVEAMRKNHVSILDQLLDEPTH